MIDGGPVVAEVDSIAAAAAAVAVDVRAEHFEARRSGVSRAWLALRVSGDRLIAESN